MKRKCSLPHSQEPSTCRYHESDQCSPHRSSHLLKINFDMTLPSTPKFHLVSFPQVSHQNPVRTDPDYHTCYMLCQIPPSSYDHPNILLSTLFSNTLILHSSFHVRHQVSHPHKKTGKISVMFILIFIIFDNKLENKRFYNECYYYYYYYYHHHHHHL
jgi:hypothetical protein